jgi:glycosyltransferase involved in cell wall biosynthesis
LLTFLQWLKIHADIQFSILIKEPGKLLPEFEKLADTYVWNGGYVRGTAMFTASRIKRKLTGKTFVKPFPVKLRKAHFDLIYLNTIASIDLGPYLKKLFKCPVIAHIHEGPYMMKEVYKGFNTISTRTAVDHFIAASKHTAEAVQTEFNVGQNAVSVVYEFVNTPAHLNNTETGFEDFFKKSFIVGAIGQAIWRKGADLFIQLASVIKTCYPLADIKFVWVGDTSIEPMFAGRLRHELSAYSLNDIVLFTGLSHNTSAFYKRFDVMVLPSREDPFPLVCLEAASFSTPLICFKDAGGMPEFIEHGNAGKVVEYGNIYQMAKEIWELYCNEQIKEVYAANAQAYARNFTAEKGSAHLWEIVKQYLS